MYTLTEGEKELSDQKFLSNLKDGHKGSPFLNLERYADIIYS
jgi:hypothetical protein